MKPKESTRLTIGASEGGRSYPRGRQISSWRFPAQRRQRGRVDLRDLVLLAAIGILAAVVVRSAAPGSLIARATTGDAATCGFSQEPPAAGKTDSPQI